MKGFYEPLLLKVISGAEETALWVEAPAMKAWQTELEPRVV